MSPTPPTLNPSQTVERIREIIVGRHLERLEGRVARLESAPQPPPVTPKEETPIFEDRLFVAEAKVEALQDQVHRIEGFHEETERIAETQRKEARLLAARIQEIARQNASDIALPAVERLERKLGQWLTDWQKSFHSYLDERDRKVRDQLKDELAELREIIEKRMSDLEGKVPVDVDDRFDRIAAAARSFAESVASFSKARPPVS